MSSPVHLSRPTSPWGSQRSGESEATPSTPDRGGAAGASNTPPEGLSRRTSASPEGSPRPRTQLRTEIGGVHGAQPPQPVIGHQVVALAQEATQTLQGIARGVARELSHVRSVSKTAHLALENSLAQFQALLQERPMPMMTAGQFDALVESLRSGLGSASTRLFDHHFRGSRGGTAALENASNAERAINAFMASETATTLRSSLQPDEGAANLSAGAAQLTGRQTRPESMQVAIERVRQSTHDLANLATEARRISKTAAGHLAEASAQIHGVSQRFEGSSSAELGTFSSELEPITNNIRHAADRLGEHARRRSGQSAIEVQRLSEQAFAPYHVLRELTESIDRPRPPPESSYVLGPGEEMPTTVAVPARWHPRGP